MDIAQLTGVAASVLTAVSLLPQVFKIISQKKVEGLSIPMILVLICGHGLWITYGIQKEDWIIIVSNGFSLVIDLVIMILTRIYPKK